MRQSSPNYKKALKLFKKASKLFESAEYLNNIAVTYLRLNKLQNAKKYLKKALKVSPEYEDAISNMKDIERYEESLAKKEKKKKKKKKADKEGKDKKKKKSNKK